MCVTDDVANPDPVTPVRIAHHVDEIWEDHPGGTLQEFYNFLVYEFEVAGAVFRARAYADDFGRVTLYGPFARAGEAPAAPNPEAEAQVTAYLERRFGEVRRQPPV